MTARTVLHLTPPWEEHLRTYRTRTTTPYRRPTARVPTPRTAATRANSAPLPEALPAPFRRQPPLPRRQRSDSLSAVRFRRCFAALPQPFRGTYHGTVSAPIRHPANGRQSGVGDWLPRVPPWRVSEPFRNPAAPRRGYHPERLPIREGSCGRFALRLAHGLGMIPHASPRGFHAPFQHAAEEGSGLSGGHRITPVRGHATGGPRRTRNNAGWSPAHGDTNRPPSRHSTHRRHDDAGRFPSAGGRPPRPPLRNPPRPSFRGAPNPRK